MIERRGRSRSASAFLRDLFDISWYLTHPLDENRTEDGLSLRNEYIEDYEDDLEEFECTLLEVLIGIAKRLDFNLYGNSSNKTVGDWFWVLVTNLKLVSYGEADPILETKKRRNYIRIMKFLERRYSPNGIGGLFPLRRADRDQRDVELWYQMMAWISEKYG